MPFQSLAQEGYMHAHPEILGKKGLKEWDKATKGKKLPEHVKKYHNGVDVVPHDTLALLQKGEKVIPAKDNPMATSADWREGVTGSKKPPKKEIKEIRTRRTHDGKMIHVHIHHHPEHHPDEEHVSSNMADLHSHFENHAGTPNEGEAPEAGAPEAAQLTAAPTPQPVSAAGSATPGM